MARNEAKKRTIFIASSIGEWGGSEELWSKAVPFLRNKGYAIVACRPFIIYEHPKIADLVNHGVEFLQTHSLPEEPVQLSWSQLTSINIRKFFGIKEPVKEPVEKAQPLLPIEQQFDWPAQVLTFDQALFTQNLKSHQPELVVISQGGNFDGLIYGEACRANGVPYVIVSHKTVDFYWPPTPFRERMRQVYLQARQCFFVSQHTKRFTEEQFGVRLPDSQVIFNPVKITEIIPYPDTDEIFQLCCMGRLDVVQKGQDILIRALSDEKWKSRPIQVKIIGAGPDEGALRELAILLGVEDKVVFAGEVSNIDQIWRECHALVLPSRAEGLPLVIVEAMMAGRPVITTDVGGNIEFLEDGVTGFVGYANDVSFAQTLDRAWEHRARWSEMGSQAARAIRGIVPPAPEKIFADLIVQHLGGDHDFTEGRVNDGMSDLPGGGKAGTINIDFNQKKPIGMEQPLVSIIIPTYNRADKVGNAIRSAQQQVYKNIQLIVVDDGSSDGTRELLRDWPGIEYVYQKNAGQADARNTGYAAARGEFIASLDSDDHWNPDFLQKCMDAMLTYNLDFVFANWDQEQHNGELEDYLLQNPYISPFIKRYLNPETGRSWVVLPERELRQLYLAVNPSPSSSAVMRKSSMVGGWNKKLRIGDDWGLFLDMIFKRSGCRAGFTMEKLWYKHVHEQNIFDGRSREDILEAIVADDRELINMYREFLTDEESDVLRTKYVRDSVELAKLAAIKRKKYITSFNLAQKSFREMPFQTCREVYNIFQFALHYRLVALRRSIIGIAPKRDAG